MGEIIRRTKNGKFLGFYLRFYEAGRRRMLASKQPTFLAAKRMLAEIEARLARGELGIPEPRCDTWPTVAELAERFLVEYEKPRIKDIHQYRWQSRAILKKTLNHIGSFSTAQINQSHIIKMRNKLSREREPGTVRNAINRLSVLFAWGVKQGLAPANPCKEVERPIGRYSADFLSQDETQRLLDAARERADTLVGKTRYVALALALHTGLRKGELFGLRWTDLDLDTRRLTVAWSYMTRPKNDKIRHMRLPKALVPILKEWKNHCNQSIHVIPIRRNLEYGRNSILGLRQLMAEIGLRDVLHPWHMLRHTFASHFMMAGGNILTLQKILGHSDLRITMQYAHLSPDFLSEEMERVKFKL